MISGSGERDAAMLRLENAYAYYRSGDTVIVGIQKINLTFSRGEFVLITGESGSGKSTLLNVISALHPYQDGDMFINGESTLWYDENDWEEYRRRHIGFVFQDYRLIEGYTALQNVMAPMLLMGVEEREARRKAGEWIARVGLAGLEKRRAAKMSSGQKQRLSIARALAKGTDIIVADEPTGNLDEENGRAIVELLSELANDRLVIMVSHNVAQAEPYATRRVRLHEGTVAADEQLRSPHEAAGEKESASGGDMKKTTRRIASFNRRAQPGRAALITLFMAAVLTAAFMLLTTFLANMDDTPTRIYDDTAFKNGDNTRLVVRRTDGAAVTEADLAYFRSLKRVREVDSWDYINDCVCFWRKDEDYYLNEYVENTYIGPEIVESKNKASVMFLPKGGSFMRTASALTPEDLYAGSLPQTVNDIVFYGDPALLGTQIRFYFKDTVAWGIGDFVGMDMTVVGILKEPTGQIYFSRELARAFLVNAFGYERLFLFYKKPASPTANPQMGYYLPIVFPDETVPEGGIVPSDQFTDDLSAYEPEMFISREIDGQWEQYPPALIASGLDLSGKLTVKVNPVDFLADDLESLQASVYIEHYAYTDDVMRAILASGAYDVCSPYRDGSLRYDQAKVKVSLATLAVSAAALVLAPFLEALILLTILKFSLRDFITLRSLGMSAAAMRAVNRQELSFYAIIGIPVAAALTLLLVRTVQGLGDLLVYFRWYHSFILLALHALSAALLVTWHNRRLVRQFKRREAAL